MKRFNITFNSLTDIEAKNIEENFYKFFSYQGLQSRISDFQINVKDLEDMYNDFKPMKKYVLLIRLSSLRNFNKDYDSDMTDLFYYFKKNKNYCPSLETLVESRNDEKVGLNDLLKYNTFTNYNDIDGNIALVNLEENIDFINTLNNYGYIDNKKCIATNRYNTLSDTNIINKNCLVLDVEGMMTDKETLLIHVIGNSSLKKISRLINYIDPISVFEFIQPYKYSFLNKSNSLLIHNELDDETYNKYGRYFVKKFLSLYNGNNKRNLNKETKLVHLNYLLDCYLYKLIEEKGYEIEQDKISKISFMNYFNKDELLNIIKNFISREHLSFTTILDNLFEKINGISSCYSGCLSARKKDRPFKQRHASINYLPYKDGEEIPENKYSFISFFDNHYYLSDSPDGISEQIFYNFNPNNKSLDELIQMMKALNLFNGKLHYENNRARDIFSECNFQLLKDIELVPESINYRDYPSDDIKENFKEILFTAFYNELIKKSLIPGYISTAKNEILEGIIAENIYDLFMRLFRIYEYVYPNEELILPDYVEKLLQFIFTNILANKYGIIVIKHLISMSNNIYNVPKIMLTQYLNNFKEKMVEIFLTSYENAPFISQRAFLINNNIVIPLKLFDEDEVGKNVISDIRQCIYGKDNLKYGNLNRTLTQLLVKQELLEWRTL